MNIPIMSAGFDSLHLADQSKIPVEGAVNIWFVMNGVVYRHEFLVIKNSIDPIIMGMNFFQQTGRELHIIPRTHCKTSQIEVSSQISSLKMKLKDEINENNIEQHIQNSLDVELPRFEEIKSPSEVTQHTIVMKHSRPIRQRYYPRNPAMQQIINDQIDELLKEGKIETSKSPYSSPIVLVKKKNNEWRLCVDFRQINENSIRDAYPIPQINSILEKLKNSKYFSTIDLRNGYWQIPMSSESKMYTAFTVPGRGLFQ